VDGAIFFNLPIFIRSGEKYYSKGIETVKFSTEINKILCPEVLSDKYYFYQK